MNLAGQIHSKFFSHVGDSPYKKGQSFSTCLNCSEQMRVCKISPNLNTKQQSYQKPRNDYEFCHLCCASQVFPTQIIGHYMEEEISHEGNKSHILEMQIG